VLWYIIFFVILLKIPTVYLLYVVWWAVKDPPQPDGGLAADGSGAGADGPEPGSSWWKRRPPRRPSRPGPHGSPERRPEPALTRARAKPPA